MRNGHSLPLNTCIGMQISAWLAHLSVQGPTHIVGGKPLTLDGASTVWMNAKQ